MKRFLILLASLMPTALLFASPGGINLTPDPKAIYRSTGTWTAPQNFKSSTTFANITVAGTCTGCGGGGSGNFATLTSPATGFYDMGGVGALIRSTGVALTSGTINIGTGLIMSTNGLTLNGDIFSSATWNMGATTVTYSSSGFIVTYQGQPISFTFQMSSNILSGSSGTMLNMYASTPGIAPYQFGSFLPSNKPGMERVLFLISSAPYTAANSAGEVIAIQTPGTYTGNLLSMKVGFGNSSAFLINSAGVITTAGGVTTALGNGSLSMSVGGGMLVMGNTGTNNQSSVRLAAGGAGAGDSSIISFGYGTAGGSNDPIQNFAAMTASGTMVGGNRNYSIAHFAVIPATSTARGAIALLQSSAPKNGSMDNYLVLNDTNSVNLSVVNASGCFVIGGSTSYLGSGLTVLAPTERVNNTTISSYTAVISTTLTPGLYQMAITTNGHVSFGGNPPTIGAGDCGSTPEGVVTYGTDFEGLITIGGGVGTTCKLTFYSPFVNPPTPHVNDNSATISAFISAVDNKSVTFGLGTGGLAAGKLYYAINGHKE